MKKAFRHLDVVQIIGFTLSATISLTLYLLNKPDSLIIGLVLAILAQLFDLQKRLKDSEELILEATILDKSLYVDNWLRKWITQIVLDYHKSKEAKFEFMRSHSQRMIVECANALHSITTGEIISQRQRPVDFSTELLGLAKKEVKAADTGNIEYWKDQYMVEYLKLNIEAIKNRKLKIQRVFIYPREIIKENLEILRKQRNGGVDVYVAFIEELPHELKEDYIIVDDQIANLVQFSGDGHVIGNKITINQNEIEKVSKKFTSLIRYARSLDLAMTDLNLSN
jgi:hypothetical protein